MTAIQGISGYQMQLQSVNSRVQELLKSSDNNSVNMASTLKKQASYIQEKLEDIEEANQRKIRDQEIQEMMLYDQRANQINDINAGSFFDIRV